MFASRTVRIRVVCAATVALLAWAGLSRNSSAAVNLPGGTTLDKVDFERHVMGLFGRMGCNSGSCHGSFQGKGGLQLSLFGFEPSMDYTNLTRGVLARRINAVDPDSSLMLLKATGAVEHGGGVRFGKDSWQYKTIRQWIADGAVWNKGSGNVVKVSVDPPEVGFGKAGQDKQLKVTANFTNGDVADITPFCDFRTNDDAVADVSNLGVVRSLKAGATAVVVSYRGNVVPVRILVPMDLPAGFVYPQLKPVNFIDDQVFARLKMLNMVPSDLAPDTEFLRRVYVDTVGTLPTPEQIRNFLADKNPNKRTKLIDDLLVHPMHASLWATKFCDITGNDTQALEGNPVIYKAKRSQLWHDWFKKRVAENMPYDEIVKGILLATSREGMSPEDWIKHTNVIDDQMAKGHDSDYADRKTLDLFWRRQQQVPIEIWAEKTAAAFLGVRLECAQCHKHPFDRWSQAEYRAFANVFAQINVGASPEAKKLIDAENVERKKTAPKANQTLIVREMFVGNPLKSLPDPETGKPLPAKAPGGPVIKYEPGKDMRVALFDWMRAKDNPFFARSFVNRIWAHYFGIGIVHPVDDFSLANPPSNDKLLDALAQDFIDSGFDIRALERKILLSYTYQLTSKTNTTNKLDRNNYAHSYIRPMLAEVMVDVINSALGVQEKWGTEVKPGSKAIEVGASVLVQSPQMTYAFRIFGRPPRTAACDCERAGEPALPQTLYLMTDKGLLDKINLYPESRLKALLNSKMTDGQILDELFLASLSRYPTPNDLKVFQKAQQKAKSREQLFADVTWALLNLPEFRLQH